MIKVKNPFNAQVYLTLNNLNIVVDPWIKNGIYENSWCLNPEIDIEQCIKQLKKADICLISHIHEDHFDLSAINYLPEDCQIILPNMWPNNIVAKRKLKNRNVRFFEIEKSYEIDDETVIRFIGPLNAEGHLSGKKEKDDSDKIVLDTGIIIKNKTDSIVLLCDNFPWNFKQIEKETLKYITECTLMALPFNSFADDFPVCFDSYTKKEKKEISLRRNEQRLNAILDFCKKVRPLNVMPYSSDFFIKGPRAIDFNDCHPEDYKCRQAFSLRMKKDWDGNVIPVSENQILSIKNKKILIEGKYKKPNFKKICNDLYSENPNNVYDKKSKSEINELIKEASLNMFKKMNQLNLKSNWNLHIDVKDLNTLYNIDLTLNKVSNKVCQKKYIKCNINSGHLFDLLTFKTHWDNERISYNLSWERSVDEYEPNINKSINFFHTILKESKT
tara:strand:- start:19294 stop:20625 length:1332 start_codon:yes stop_codon:yes gene_type:complete